MNFLDDAQTSFTRITCKTVRSILSECAAETLRRTIQPRIQIETERRMQLRSDNYHDDGGDNDPSTPIQITEQDIETVYKVTHHIGRRWVQKLMASEHKHDNHRHTCNIVEFVLRNGKFLEPDYVDDVHELNSCLVHSSSGVSATPRGTDADSDSSSDSLSLSSLASVQGHRHHRHKKNSLESIQQSIPYTTLLNIGQLDPCNLNPTSTSTTNAKLENGTAAEWHPMPTLEPQSLVTSTSTSTSTPLVHIPNPTLLPPDQRKEQRENQLYGLPAIEMPRSMDLKHSIALMDEMGMSQGPTHALGRTMWPFDWKIIEDQAEQNHDRLHSQNALKAYSRTIDGDGSEEMVAVIPRFMLNDVVDTATTNANASASATNGDDGGTNNNDNDDLNGGERLSTAVALPTPTTVEHEHLFVGVSDEGGTQRLSATKAFKRAIVSSRLKRGWDSINIEERYRLKNGQGNRNGRQNQSTDKGDLDHSMVVAKQPSSFGDRQWTRDQIVDELGEDVLRELEDTMLHQDNEEEAMQYSSSCQGALKKVGNIHLWEQVRSDQWEGRIEIPPCKTEEIAEDTDKDSDSDMHTYQNSQFVDKEKLKLRKKTHRKAKRQRLYPNYEEGTKGYNDSKFRSKTIWAVKDIDKDGNNTRRCTDNIGSYKCLELDLADCVVSIVPSHGQSAHALGTKKSMVFRSLEVCLSE